ncbi:MAG: hypothetical protein LAO04_12255 [Acidobacteriia bacterium]|nr:hypothetical protein [Terriglobia bacterium]
MRKRGEPVVAHRHLAAFVTLDCSAVFVKKGVGRHEILTKHDWVHAVAGRVEQREPRRRVEHFSHILPMSMAIG